MEILLNIAIEASLKAGEKVMEIYDTTFDIEFKDDKSPITKADKKANTVINSFLSPTAIPIISEENKQTSFSTRSTWNTCWIVDPVDGTKEFIKRNGEFTINIALIDAGKPVLGVIYAPASKTLYYANNNQNKAYKVQLSDHNTSIANVFEHAKPLKPKENSREQIDVVASRSHMSQETLVFIDNLKSQGKDVDIVSIGSSLKFCLVAEGSADVYPRFAPTMEWDTAAGQAICNAVGIRVISQETNKSLLYNKENLLNPSFTVYK
jgi:3'(2'), 5'-bisphosphate nucleotidase